MTTYTAKAAKAGDKMLATITGAQDGVVRTVATVSEMAGSYLPALPLPAVPATVPTTREVFEQSFKFVEKAIKAQKTYALNLIDALEPISSKLIRHETKKSARSSATAS